LLRHFPTSSSAFVAHALLFHTATKPTAAISRVVDADLFAVDQDTDLVRAVLDPGLADFLAGIDGLPGPLMTVCVSIQKPSTVTVWTGASQDSAAPTLCGTCHMESRPCPHDPQNRLALRFPCAVPNCGRLQSWTPLLPVSLQSRTALRAVRLLPLEVDHGADHWP
jgi:hypothetical protein